MATEDYLFQHLDEESSVLFLWQNAPSLIIGRAQNPYLECQLRRMEDDGVLLARRQSGGGTVYHDLGNLNFTFISPLSTYSKDANFDVILRALHALGLPAFRSPRNDLLIRHDGEDRKISGSAFRETKTRAFHHGTLLLQADLTRLRNYLTPVDKDIEAKGVKSVRSTVMNLTDIVPTLTLAQLQSALMQAFDASVTPEVLSESALKDIPSLAERYAEYASFEWRFGRTLPFVHRLHTTLTSGELSLELSVEAGHLTDVRVPSCPLNFPTALLTQTLRGVRYDRVTLSDALVAVPEFEEVRQWLIREV